jgi:hypothetical protein
MAGKIYEKRKKRREFMRQQVNAGLINFPDGSWRRPDAQNSMGRDMIGGYRVGQRRK